MSLCAERKISALYDSEFHTRYGMYRNASFWKLSRGQHTRGCVDRRSVVGAYSVPSARPLLHLATADVLSLTF